MSELVLGKCRYCGSDVFYDSGKTYTKCSVCGQTLVIAEFQNEQIKLKRIEEERDQLKKDLEAAEKAIEAEQEKVWKVISEMDGLRGSLKEQETQLNKLLKESQLDQETQKSILSLLRTMKTDQQQGQNSILSVINQIVSEQDTAAQKLSALQAVSAQLTDQNSDILSSVNQIAAWLHSESKQKNQIISNLFTWLSTHSEQDQAQLKQINAVSSSILAKQDMIGGKVDDLRNKVTENQRAIQSFQGKWEESQLNQLVEQYHQAETLQLDMDFDKAEDEYRKVIVLGGKDPEVYWRIILCHYGVVYQKDNDGNLIPTILSPDLSSQLSIVKNLENSYRSEEDRQYYSTRLKQINNLLDKYRRCKLDYQYDVFISVKQKRQINGEETYTKDYKIGADLFDHLTKKGLRVFNSEQPSCQNPGEEWEPYILAALLSSKVMIVVGTSTEYMESQWVQNEWRRFQWLQGEEKKKTDKTDRKLLCFIDHMTGYDLPKDLEPIQAIVNEAGAYNKLDKVIDDIFPKNTSPVPPITRNIESLRQRMISWLAFRQFDLVKEEYIKVIREGIYALDAQINLYSICADHNLSNISMLETASFDLSQEEKIQIILENSKDQKDLDMLEDLLNKNKKNKGGNDVPPPEPPLEKKEPSVPVIQSLELKDNDGRLDQYLGKYNMPLPRRNEPYHPASDFFLIECTNMLFARVDYQSPLESDTESISWQIIKADGKPLTKQITKQKKITPGTVKRSIVYLTNEKQWVSGEYTLYMSVNGSKPVQKRFTFISLDSRKKGEQTVDKFFEQLLQKANAGNADAQNELGNRYRYGIGVNRNARTAFKWYRMSAEQGNAVAQNTVGMMYQYGEGTPRDYPEAIKWYRKSAEQGNSDAQNNLGLMYYRGYSVGQDYAQAALWYRTSAEQGNADAQNNLGWMFQHGYGVLPDDRQAVIWYRKSAEQGNAKAQNNLGVMYEQGHGVMKDYAQAAVWYRKSAEQGNAIAQFNLGWMYQHGYGVSRDYTQALAWYRKSAEQGNEDAKYALERINS